jgi:hypothetical protein
LLTKPSEQGVRRRLASAYEGGSVRSPSSRFPDHAGRIDSNRWINRRPAERDNAAIFSRQVQALRELYERSRLDRDARHSDVRR